MYKLLLTFRYLRRRLIPIFALLAVMLCTAMVIIVISVMGGFLDLLRGAGRTLMGDVSVTFGLSGFPHYQELVTELRKLPEVSAATPLVEAFGLLKLPGDVIRPVHVYGIDGADMNRVTRFRDTLHWTPQRLEKEKRVKEYVGAADPVAAALAMRPPWEGFEKKVAIVPGLEISPYNYRKSDGTYLYQPSILGTGMTLTVLPISKAGGVDTITPETRQVMVVNEFNSGVYEVDSKQVFVPFAVAQEMMRMQEAARQVFNADGSPKVDADGNFVTQGTEPARASWIYVRAHEGVDVDYLRGRVEETYLRLAKKHDDMPTLDPMSIATWEQRQAKFLGAVENERGLMTVLFGIISIVAVMIVGVIFYMIVLEKTRDIGILRAIGASQPGVASIFLAFGLVVGTLGAALGRTIAYLIVTYINEIHDWLGRTFGIVIWDRSIYFFDRIPSRIDWNETTVIVAVAIVASVIGAIIPAFKAARVDPVESLRYE